MADSTPIALAISPSQLNTFEELCPRKHWYRYARNCPEPSGAPQTYGLALHAIVERFLKATANGRDPKTGQPVELFPPGWEWHEKSQARVSPAEADQIKRLVGQAISLGVLRRPAGEFRVEAPYSRVVDRTDAGLVVERGVIDLIHPSGIDDHKTTAARKWAKSEAKLRTDPQMLSYGVVWAQAVKTDQDVELRHNVYVRGEDAPTAYLKQLGLKAGQQGFVFQRTVAVTRDELAARREKTQATALEMLKYRALPDEAWEEVPGARPGSDACNAYRGCPYRLMCPAGGGPQAETPTMYRERLARAATYKADQERRQKEMANAKEAAGPPRQLRTMAALLGKREEPVKSVGTIDEQVARAEARAAERLREEAAASAAQQRTTRLPEMVREVAEAKARITAAAEVPPPAISHDEEAPINPIGRDPLQGHPDPGAYAMAELERLREPGLAEIVPPPWWCGECKACMGSAHLGWSTKLDPCKICQVHARRLGKPTADQFATGVEDGRPWWRAQGVVVPGAFGAAPEPQPEPIAAPQAAQAAAPVQDPPPAPAETQAVVGGAGPVIEVKVTYGEAEGGPVADAVTRALENAPRRGRGRPRKDGTPAQPRAASAPRPQPDAQGVQLVADFSLQDGTLVPEGGRILELIETVVGVIEQRLVERLLVLGGEPVVQAEPIDSATVEIGRDLLRSAQDEIEALKQQLAVEATARHQAEQRAELVEGDVRAEARAGFELLIGCRISKAQKEEGSVDFMEVFDQAGRDLAKHHGVASYYLLDTWKRRDHLAAVADELAKQLDGRVVFAMGVGPGTDAHALLTALRPLARRVVEA